MGEHEGDQAALVGDMPEEEFRRTLAEFSAWVCRYRERVAEFPVLARVVPGDLEAQLPNTPPVQGDAPERWLEDLDRLLVPGVTHWNHPGFMAYFGITGSGPGILGELVSAALNVNGMLWRTSPALTELECVVLRWYRLAMGLPSQWFGMLTDTASTSTLVALTAAREAAGLNIREAGMAGQPAMLLYCSQEAHSSVEKAGLVLGVGRSGVVRIPTDEKLRMDPGALEQAILADATAGRRPFAVVATVGTTSTAAVDPVAAVADICARHDLWLHVDAAYAGSAAMLPEYRWALAGCDRADSLVANPHKWLFTPIDCSALFTSRPEVFRQALSLVPEYLRSDGESLDLMDYTFQLGRRFRALKLWFVFRYFGTAGISDRIRAHCNLAQEFVSWVADNPDLELAAEPAFSVVCFRARPAGIDEDALDELNQHILAAVNASGRVFLSHTRVAGKLALRLAVGNLGTRREQLRDVLRVVCRELEQWHHGRRVSEET